METPSGEVVWARRPLPGSKRGKVAHAHWHRVALVKDSAVKTICGRVFESPVDMLSDVPPGSAACQRCTDPAEQARVKQQPE